MIILLCLPCQGLELISMQKKTMKNSRIAGDPINIVIVGSKEAIHEAFTSAGWSVADKLTLSKKRLCCIALWIGGNA